MSNELLTIPHTTHHGRADHPLKGLAEALEKIPAFKTLCKAAAEESLFQAAGDKFSRQQADADHEAASAALRQNPNAENMARLKDLGGLDQRRRAYEEHAAAIREDLRKLRRKNFPVLEQVTFAVIEIFLLHARQARADIDAAFEKHNLPTPEAGTIEAPFWATARWYQHNLKISEEGFGMAFGRLVEQLRQ